MRTHNSGKLLAIEGALVEAADEERGDSKDEDELDETAEEDDAPAEFSEEPDDSPTDEKEGADVGRLPDRSQLVEGEYPSDGGNSNAEVEHRCDQEHRVGFEHVFVQDGSGEDHHGDFNHEEGDAGAHQDIGDEFAVCVGFSAFGELGGARSEDWQQDGDPQDRPGVGLQPSVA
jgi:hypothetical protein